MKENSKHMFDADEQRAGEGFFYLDPHDQIAIYQLKHEDNTRDIRFESYESLKNMGGEVNRENYDLVYVCDFECSDKGPGLLEKIYAKFNTDLPDDFIGHSLSVSDMVAVKQDGEVSYHYVDSCGFETIKDFGYEANRELLNDELEDEPDFQPEKEKQIRVVKVEPGKPAVETTMDNTLEAMQEMVGGYIEYVHLPGGVDLVCNEEGKLEQLEPNRRLQNDVICGTFFLCRDDGYGENTSLTQADVDKYLKLYENPEQITQAEAQSHLRMNFYGF